MYRLSRRTITIEGRYLLKIRIFSFLDSIYCAYFQRNTIEFYEMKLDAREIHLTADSYFGLRHGLETLSQLWDYDDIHQRFVIPANFTIIDGPEFKHRGVMLDSSRNFIPIDVIKRVIEGMSFNKVRKKFQV